MTCLVISNLSCLKNSIRNINCHWHFFCFVLFLGICKRNIVFKVKHLAFNDCTFLTLLIVSSSFNHLQKGRYRVLKLGNRTLASPPENMCDTFFKQARSASMSAHHSLLRFKVVHKVHTVCPKLNHPDFTQITTPIAPQITTQMLQCNICFGYAPDWEILEWHILHHLACFRSHHWTESTFSSFWCHWGGELAKI